MTEQSPSDRLNRTSNDILDATSFLSGTNAAFLEGLYAQYLANPDSVDEGWRAYFAELGEAGLTPTQLGRGPAWRRDQQDRAAAGRNSPQALSGGQRRRQARAEKSRAPRRVGRRKRPRHGAGFHPRHPAGARLSRHRPSGSRSRSPGDHAAPAASAAGAVFLRLPRRGDGQADLYRRRAWAWTPPPRAR